MTRDAELVQTDRRVRYRLTVTGVVQGVGFRPFVYNLALRHGLAGFVGNDSGGVFMEVEGPPRRLDEFQRELTTQAPPLAHIERVAKHQIPVQHDVRFRIVHSTRQPASNTLISPDISICDDCLQELFDPKDRRFRYPFINCTNCGPRFTIVQDIPYDRPLTTMRDFVMCSECQREYDDPADRRFHAQPNACPQCGPHIWLELFDGQSGSANNPENSAPVWRGEEALQQARALLAAGKIVAVKGLGGFHLACDAASDRAVSTLRERKGRVDKPFALMARDMDGVRRIAEVSPAEEALLTSRERPIVLLRKRTGSGLSALIAPGNPNVGVMLPYTPLHYLLLEEMGSGAAAQADGQPSILVMTSANYSDEPIVKDNDEARRRLASLADALLLHDRDIHVHCDDSVVRVFQDAPLPLRRSRGYAPFPVTLPFSIPPTLAVGGELKSTFCLAQGRRAFMSQHIGDMGNWETLQAFERAVEHMISVFRCEPRILVADLHPGYMSRKWAETRAAGRQLFLVQHHHAHIAGVMAEHGIPDGEPVIGFSFDGTGYGTDGAIWGGEVLLADYRGFQRVAHLKYVPLPGGDAAILRPYRTALAHLWAAGVPWEADLAPVAAATPTERGVVQHQLETGLNTVPTSSMGRLFDAVAALADVRQRVTYEAQAAMELEALVPAHLQSGYAFAFDGQEFDAAPVIRSLVADIRSGVPAPVIAGKFHVAVAELMVAVAEHVRRVSGVDRVALSGGVFQNVALLKLAVDRLRVAKFSVLVHRLVPPNDGGLALGQAVLAGVRDDQGTVGVDQVAQPLPSPGPREEQQAASQQEQYTSRKE